MNLLNKPTAIFVALVFTAVAANTTAHETDDMEPWAITVGPEGIVPESEAMNFGLGECDAQAPEETYCGTLVHISLDQPHHTLFGDFDVTYSLESRLIHAEGARVLQITVIDGTLVYYNEYGTWPTGPFWQDCFAYEPDTMGQEIPFPMEPNGTPGGDGYWGCRISQVVI